MGESGGDKDDPGAQLTDSRVGEKFLGLCADVLGANRAQIVLDRLWRLEDLDAAEIAAQFILS